MTCSQCAAEMPEISAFCPGCGLPVHAEEGLRAANSREAVLGALAYVAVVPAIALLGVPAFRSSQFVRFHAWQSLFFAASAAVTTLVLKFVFAALSVVPGIGFLAAWLSVGLTLLALVFLWVTMTVKAAQGESYELPGISRMAAE